MFDVLITPGPTSVVVVVTTVSMGGGAIFDEFIPGEMMVLPMTMGGRGGKPLEPMFERWIPEETMAGGRGWPMIEPGGEYDGAGGGAMIEAGGGEITDAGGEKLLGGGALPGPLSVTVVVTVVAPADGGGTGGEERIVEGGGRLGGGPEIIPAGGDSGLPGPPLTNLVPPTDIGGPEMGGPMGDKGLVDP